MQAMPLQSSKPRGPPRVEDLAAYYPVQTEILVRFRASHLKALFLPFS